MKYLFFVISLVVSTLVYAQSGVKNFIDQNYIEVTGNAEMEIVPDEIYITILLSEADTKNKLSLAVQEKQMIKALDGIGIDISTKLLVKDMNSSYKSYLLSSNQIHLTKEFQLLLNDGVTASKVFKEFKKLGISNMSIEKLNHSKIEEFRNKVKVEAIEAARSKATALAGAVDQKVGRALFIQEQNFHRVYSANTAMTVRGVGSTIESEPQLDFEKIKLEYSILCRFALE